MVYAQGCVLAWNIASIKAASVKKSNGRSGTVDARGVLRTAGDVLRGEGVTTEAANKRLLQVAA